MSSPELISALQKHDKAAKRMAFEQYYSKLAGIAARYAKNQEQAEQMLNVAFNACFSKIQRSLKIDDMDAFLEKEFIQECVSFVRSIRAEYYVSSTVYATGTVTSRNYNLFENNEIIDYNHLETEVFVAALQQLVPSQRLIFNLHVVDGYSLADAAAQLESSEATVKSNLEKARYNFQKNIEKNLKQVKA